MAAFIFLYRDVYVKIVQSGILSARCLDDVLIRGADLAARGPEHFQLFIFTMLHHAVLFLNGRASYDEFKRIVYDFIQVSLENRQDTPVSDVCNNVFPVDAQSKLISCIVSRVVCDYLSYVKHCGKLNGNPRGREFDDDGGFD